MVRPIRYPFLEKTFLACFLAGALLTGCAALRRPDPPVDRSEDPRILEEVEERIAAEPSLDVERIRVEVDGRIVLLYGSVEGIGAWQCAIRTVQLVPGVVTVADYLVIDRGPPQVVCLGAGHEPSYVPNSPHVPSTP
jgi:hypothetical protein